MKDSLSSRVGRLISGSFNAMIDAIENTAPETAMEEAIRAVDSVIDEVRAELGKILANKHLADTRLAEENKSLIDLSASIEIALSGKRDDLAEAAVSKQLDIEAQIPILEATLSDCARQEKELESYILALQAKKREMLDELAAFRQSQKTAYIAGQFDGELPAHAGEQAEKAEASFDRILEKASGITPRPGLSPETEQQLAEIRETARKNRVQERLTAYKNKLTEGK